MIRNRLAKWGTNKKNRRRKKECEEKGKKDNEKQNKRLWNSIKVKIG
jgi:hypothetical protein